MNRAADTLCPVCRMPCARAELECYRGRCEDCYNRQFSHCGDGNRRPHTLSRVEFLEDAHRLGVHGIGGQQA